MAELPALGDWTHWRTRFVLFTGKGGVGGAAWPAFGGRPRRRGQACARCERPTRRRTSKMLRARRSVSTTRIASVTGLSAMNIDPKAAADEYRNQVLAPLRGAVPETELRSHRGAAVGTVHRRGRGIRCCSARLVADPGVDVRVRSCPVRYRTDGSHAAVAAACPRRGATTSRRRRGGASCLGTAGRTRNETSPVRSDRNGARRLDTDDGRVGEPTRAFPHSARPGACRLRARRSRHHQPAPRHQWAASAQPLAG